MTVFRLIAVMVGLMSLLVVQSSHANVLMHLKGTVHSVTSTHVVLKVKNRLYFIEKDELKGDPRIEDPRSYSREAAFDVDSASIAQIRPVEEKSQSSSR